MDGSLILQALAVLALGLTVLVLAVAALLAIPVIVLRGLLRIVIGREAANVAVGTLTATVVTNLARRAMGNRR